MLSLSTVSQKYLKVYKMKMEFSTILRCMKALKTNCTDCQNLRHTATPSAQGQRFTDK